MPEFPKGRITYGQMIKSFFSIFDANLKLKLRILLCLFGSSFRKMKGMAYLYVVNGESHIKKSVG